MQYYISKMLDLPYAQAVERAVEELKKEGFGILTEIDVKATLKKKLDLDFRPYVILGACNPPLAHRAIEAEDKIGTLLPCNVMVQELAAGKAEVAVMDPGIMAELSGNPALAEIATEVRGRLLRVIAAL